MLVFYKSKQDSIDIIPESGPVQSLPFPKGQLIRAAINGKGQIAFAYWTEDSKSALAVYDLSSKTQLWGLDGAFYDLAWFDEKSLVVSNGKTLAIVSGEGKARQELCSYSRRPYGPLDMKISPVKSVLAFLRWEGDQHKPTFLFLGSGHAFKSKHSCLNLILANERQAIFDYGGSIYQLEIGSDTKTRLLKSTRQLCDQASRDLSNDFSKLRSVLDDPSCSIDQLSNPTEHNGRIYFSSFVCANNQKCISLLSVNAEIGDLRIHQQFGQGLIRAIYISPTSGFVAMRLWPNLLRSEKIEPGWYFQNGQQSGFREDSEAIRF